MLGDNIIVKERHKSTARQIHALLPSLSSKKVITVAGESGSGKSTLSLALKEVLETHSQSVEIIHMDDYFILPPSSNHDARLKDISQVGTDEVDLDLLQSHVDSFIAGKEEIQKPLVNFSENTIGKETLNFIKKDILIVEGTFVTKLDNIDTRIFLTRDFEDTYDARMNRGRDQGTEFVEKVLEIEHKIIYPDQFSADIIVDKKYEVSLNPHPEWWKRSIMYQIYPRSYQDTTGNGFGDLKGIQSRIPYIKSLGIDIIWLSPIYTSPDVDYGYDISDYYSIDPKYGDINDFQELLEEVHSNNMKLIMDLVVNHSSDQHAFFQQSRLSKTNKYRNFYIWRDNVNNQPPNNWMAWFGGSAWNYDELTDSWYLALFTPQQPDFNWENPAVREEVYKNMRYWLDKGVDGFRMDVISLLSKKPGLPDSPSQNISFLAENYYANGPKIHDYLQEMHREVLSKYDIMTVGEGPGITKDKALLYVGRNRNELNMIFQLDLMFGDHGKGGKFDINPIPFVKFKEILDSWDGAVAQNGWNNVFLDNHDFPRLVSRFGNDKNYRVRSSKMLILFLMSLRGTPCIYQGSEIGMTNVRFDDPADYKDVEAINYFDECKEKGISIDVALRNMHIQGRDNARTPMQWNNTKHAGFTHGLPWINVNPNYTEINVQEAESDDDSILHFYRKVIALKKSNKTLLFGNYISHFPDHSALYVIERNTKSNKLICLFNFSDNEVNIPMELDISSASVVISNLKNTHSKTLQPWEGTIYKI